MSDIFLCFFYYPAVGVRQAAFDPLGVREKLRAKAMRMHDHERHLSRGHAMFMSETTLHVGDGHYRHDLAVLTAASNFTSQKSAVDAGTISVFPSKRRVMWLMRTVACIR